MLSFFARNSLTGVWRAGGRPRCRYSLLAAHVALCLGLVVVSCSPPAGGLPDGLPLPGQQPPAGQEVPTARAPHAVLVSVLLTNVTEAPADVRVRYLIEDGTVHEGNRLLSPAGNPGEQDTVGPDEGDTIIVDGVFLGTPTRSTRTTLDVVPFSPRVFHAGIHFNDGDVLAVSVEPDNQAPVAFDSSATTQVETPVQIVLHAEDLDQDPLTFTIETGPQHGGLADDDGDDRVIYTPDPNYVGPDEFTFTAADALGESNTARVTIEVTTLPNNAPEAVCQGVTAPADGSCQAAVSPVEFDGGSFDPDGDPLFFEADPAGPYPLGTTTLTLTVTDDKGLPDTCTADVTVVDETGPDITCPGPVTVECDASTDPNDTGVATATDNCDPAPILSHSDSVTPGANAQEWTITRTWTAADASDNSASCDQIITVEDTTAPQITCAGPMTVECDASTDPNDTGVATATDNCDPAPVVAYSDSVTPGANAQEWTITRTWTATDASDNSASCDQIITVVDTTAPNITCPSDTTVECDESTDPNDTGVATATDNCDPAPVISYSDSVAGGSCPQASTITRTWTATDASDNSSSCDQTITVEDTTAPDITCPADITILPGDPNDPSHTGMATATDNCDASPVVGFTDSVTTSGAGTTVIERTWTATDACGNAASCMQTITVAELVAELDIKPGSCPNSFNPGSHGVLPVGLLGTAGFDVADVDPNSVRLSRADGVGGSVAPHEGPPGPHTVIANVGTPFDGDPCECHELEGDGIDDMSMKFKVDQLVPALQLGSVSPGALVELVVSGTLTDGRGFVASDCVRIVPPNSPPANVVVSSTGPGAWFDVAPLDLRLDDGGFADPSFTRVFSDGSAVTVTAAATFQTQSFVGWRINGAAQPVPGLSVLITVQGDQTLDAVYSAP